MRRTAEFLLHDWLHVESLAERPRFAEHSREAFASVRDDDAAQGRHAAKRFFFAHELPKVAARLSVVSSRDATCREMKQQWF